MIGLGAEGTCVENVNHRDPAIAEVGLFLT